MANSAYLATMLITAVAVAGVAVLTLRVRRWRQYSPQVSYGGLDGAGGRRESALSRFANAPRAWTAAYLLLALGFLAGATAYAGGAALGIPATAVIGALVVVIVAYLVGGVYLALREHGRPSAQAAAGSAALLGLLVVAAITTRLVLIA